MGDLRVFGSRVYCKNYESLKEGGSAPSKATQAEYGQKAFKAWEGIFMGFDEKVPGSWRVLSFRSKIFQNTRNMVANENLQASAAPQNFSRESLLTLLHMRQHIPLTGDQVIAFDQVVSDNRHLLYEEWYFSQDEFDPRHVTPR
jgi:hypothetical protein